jgi:hypothetical protein
MRGSSWVMTRTPSCGFGRKSEGRSSRRISPAISSFSSAWSPRSQSALVSGQQWPSPYRHPSLRWMAATLDGRVEATGAVFEAKFMLPWSFSEETAAEKYMAQLQHNMWVVASRAAVLSVIAESGWKSPPTPIPFTSISSSRPSGSSGAAWRAASPLAYLGRAAETAHRSAPYCRYERLQCLGRIRRGLPRARASQDRTQALDAGGCQGSSRHGVRAKRSKSGAVSFDLLVQGGSHAAVE